MEKVYIIKHEYDVDGGFGDAISREDVVGIVKCSEEDIKKFDEKYNKPEVYDSPYADLECHSIIIEEVTILDISDLESDPYGDGGIFQKYIDNYKGEE